MFTSSLPGKTYDDVACAVQRDQSLYSSIGVSVCSFTVCILNDRAIYVFRNESKNNFSDGSIHTVESQGNWIAVLIKWSLIISSPPSIFAP